MYASVNGPAGLFPPSQATYDGQRSSVIINDGPLNTGYDWKRKLAEHRVATEANLRQALNRKQMITRNPLSNSSAMGSHDLGMQGGVPRPLDVAHSLSPHNDEGLGHAKRELNALLGAVQSSLADLRGEVAAASHLSSHASAAMHELQAAPFHASLPPRPFSRYPSTPTAAAGRGHHPPLHPSSSSGVALPRRHGSTSILSSPAAHPELASRSGQGLAHDAHALGAPQPADVWTAAEGGEQAGYAYPTDMQVSFNGARESVGLSDLVQSKIEELGHRLEHHMQLQQAQLMRPVQAEAHNHSEALILLGVSKSEAAEKAAMELKISMSSWERQYGKDMEAAQQRVAALASSTQAHWERLCEVAASVDELQQKPPPEIPDVAPLESDLGHLREQVQTLTSRVPEELQEAAAAVEAKLKQALQQQDQMRNSLAASMLERAEARSKQQSAETKALLEQLDAKVGQQAQERAEQQAATFTAQLQQLEAQLTQQAQAAAKDSASLLQQLEARLGQQVERAQEQTKQQSAAAFEERLRQLEARLAQQAQEQAKQHAAEHAAQLQQLEAKLSQQAQAAAKDSGSGLQQLEEKLTQQAQAAAKDGASRLQQLEQGLQQAQEASKQSACQMQQLEAQLQQASAAAQAAQQPAADAQAQAQALPVQLATHKEEHAKELAAQVSQVSQKVEAQGAEVRERASQLEEGLKELQAEAALQKGQQQQQQQQQQESNSKQEPGSTQAETAVTATAVELEPRLQQLEGRLAELKAGFEEGRAADKAAVAAQAKQHDALNERVCATEEAILELDQALQQQNKQQQGDAQVAKKAAESTGLLEGCLKDLEASLKEQQAKMEEVLKKVQEQEKQSFERLSHLEATQEQQVASGLAAVEGAVHGLEDERKERAALDARLHEAEQALQALLETGGPQTQASKQEQHPAQAQQPTEEQQELMQQQLRELQHLVGSLNAQQQVLESAVHGQIQELQEARSAAWQQAAQQQSELRTLQVQQQGQVQEQGGLSSEVHMLRSSMEEVGGLVQQLEQQVQSMQQQQQQQQQELSVQHTDLQALQQQLHALEEQQQGQEEGMRAELEQHAQLLQELQAQAEKRSSTEVTATHAASSVPGSSSQHPDVAEPNSSSSSSSSSSWCRRVVLKGPMLLRGRAAAFWGCSSAADSGQPAQKRAALSRALLLSLLCLVLLVEGWHEVLLVEGWHEVLLVEGWHEVLLVEGWVGPGSTLRLLLLILLERGWS
uniref:Uncharacterized protein n=1 Tax=Dunaliella tertiolecta TaxID=3047 RepID=A0A7S3R700_DUNTE